MTTSLIYLYLLSPLHTGGTSQEGNLVGIAREAHTDFPYLPSSTIRGRLRSATNREQRNQLWGNTIEDVTGGRDENLTQGVLWIGDASILWFPVPSLSHGVVWVTSPFLLRRWLRLTNSNLGIPEVGSFSDGNSNNLYLKDAIFQRRDLQKWENWQEYLPQGNDETNTISKALILSERDSQVLVQSSLWRQVKIKLDDKKNVDGGFRYEEAIPPETLMYFPWGTTTTTTANGNGRQARESFQSLLTSDRVWQIGGQESLGRGFVALWSN
jgi:CRISPR-associated protein Cmr4